MGVRWDELGSSSAFERLYRSHYGEILAFAARRVDFETAREVASETFVVAWRRVDEIRPETARAWLFGVARGVLMNEARAQARRIRLVDRLAAENVVATSAEDVGHLRADILDTLDRLPVALREALELVEWDGLDPAEAASIVGCSASTFRVRLHRARRRLVAEYSRAEVHADTGDAPEVLAVTEQPAGRRQRSGT